MTLRHKIAYQLNHQGKLSITNIVLVVLIVLASIVAILESEPNLSSSHKIFFERLELALAYVFLVEYVCRLWACQTSLAHRVRFVRSPSAIVDLVSIIGAFVPLIGPNILSLRLVRLFRMVRLAKLGRSSSAISHLQRALRSRAPELITAAMLSAFLLLMAATLMFWAEGEVQPSKFGSIPRCLWWASMTITTVGYGDVIPVTALGKIIASLVSFLGVGLVAIPSGILAAAFTEQVRTDRPAGEDVGHQDTITNHDGDV